ncbi:AraC-like DNA-binding protein [Pseudonocardia sediminis]|uniref:AraC-like DNA-binding protein n=1 Tax=Pseudonocardia sediminis TaxID=1397368 RepID=A0A4Q7UQV4_PSEST|nr:helix-turn-helix domain-containing protein [Pseudonocardia sediminis]RZT84207.1 AraC-like DNA-binding protein [Pseudonocardia sediminis]
MAGDEESWRTGDEPGDVAEQWRDMLSATHLPWSVAVPRPETGAVLFEAAVRRWWIDDLALVDCTCGPCSGTRTRRELAGTDGEFVVVLITLAGRETVAQGDAEAGLRPGDAVVWDSTAPARFAVSEPLSKRSLLIPRAALDEVGGRVWTSGGVRLDGTKPATRLLTSYLDSLGVALPDLGPQSVRAARNATLELFVGALRAGVDTPTTTMAQPALRDAMDRYIERHLLHAAVTPAAIARAHGVSVRTVNRIFNATGQTVGEVVRVRRLARAREDLTDGDLPVSSIAHRWGFSDTSHFSRTFKAHYGSSPSEYREVARTGRADGASVQGPVAAVQRPARPGTETGVTATRG